MGAYRVTFERPAVEIVEYEVVAIDSYQAVVLARRALGERLHRGLIQNSESSWYVSDVEELT